MSRIKIRQQIKTNLVQDIDIKLLEQGMYFNVDRGDTNYNLVNLSELKRLDDPDFDANTVYQSPFQNWVFESGVAVPSGFTTPTLASGVYVNGTFKDRTDATYGHSIDYINGRVIFDSDSAVLDTDTIEADFSYKIFHIRAGQQSELFLQSSTESELKDNPRTATSVVRPNPQQWISPAVFMEVIRGTNKGFALGGGKLGTFEIAFYIYCRDGNQCDDFIDIISELEDHPFLIVNYDTISIPLDDMGDVAADYVPYQVLQSSTANLLYKGTYSGFDGTSSIPVVPMNTRVITGKIIVERPDI